MHIKYKSKAQNDIIQTVSMETIKIKCDNNIKL